MRIRISSKAIVGIVGLLVWNQCILSVKAVQDISDNSKDLQDSEINDVGSLIKNIQIETAKDGTLVDENHSTLLEIVFDMLENQGEPNLKSFTLPINSEYEISAGTWHYGASFKGGYHLGIDFALPISSDVKAVSDGIIIATSNACMTIGHLGNSCGYPGTEGGGNQIYLLTKVKETCYIIKYLHLRQDSLISVGAYVKQNDKIGEIGSSGNSSGPHLHIEVIRIKEKSLNEFLDNWDGDLSFQMGFGQSGYEDRCEVNLEEPCREKPEVIFGLD